MPKFKNVSPLGDLELPLLGGAVVRAGEVVEVSAAQARLLAGQEAVWQPVTARKAKGTTESTNDAQGGAGEDESTGEGEGA